MTWEYTTNLEDFKAAQRLAIRRNKKTLVSFFILQRVMPVLAVVSLAVLIWDLGFHHASLTPVAGAVLFMLVWLGFYLPFQRWFQIRRLYKATKNGRPEAEPLHLELAGEELISRIPGLSEGRLFPTAVQRFSDDEHVCLIWITPKNFLFIPRCALKEADWQLIRTWVASAKRPESKV